MNNIINAYINSQYTIIELTNDNNRLINEADSWKNNYTELKTENNILTLKVNELESKQSSVESNTASDNKDDSDIPNNSNDYVDFLSVCQPHFMTPECEIIADSIKMSGDYYSNGIIITARRYHSDVYLLFNLKEKYSKLTFEVGHVDNTSMYDCEIYIYLDDVDSNAKKPLVLVLKI